MQIIVRSVALATALATTAPAFAERAISGAEAQRLLAGKAFQVLCIDGTSGRGHFGPHNVVTVSYRRGGLAELAGDQSDRATVQARGNEICISWTQFDGGGNSCYPVSEHTANSYRIGSVGRWCDITAR